MIKFKSDVQLKGVRPEITLAMVIIADVKQRLDNSSHSDFSDAVITSYADGDHGAGSLHARGAAIDIRIKDLTPEKTQQFYLAIKEALPDKDFDVVLEPDHIHVEFDPKY